jgi:2-methylcitrate dehydratase PrpD
MASTQPTTSLSSTVAEFVHATPYGDLPRTATSITRQHLLDTIGCSLAATKVDTSRLLSSTFRIFGDGSPLLNSPEDVL